MVNTLTIFAHRYTHAKDIPPIFPFKNERFSSPTAGSVTSRQSLAASSHPEMPQLKSCFAQGNGSSLRLAAYPQSRR